MNINKNEIPVFIERVKFYADTPEATNKLFTFKIDSMFDISPCLWRFIDKGINIRAAWYEVINAKTKEKVKNEKIDVTAVKIAWTDFHLYPEEEKNRIERMNNRYKG